MNLGKAEKIARTVLYEGYMLYPYRASALKNRQRCAFGTLYPEHDRSVAAGVEQWRNQTQCLVKGDAAATIRLTVRFLQLVSRRVEARVDAAEDEFNSVDALVVGDQIYQSLDEACERNGDAEIQLGEVADAPRELQYHFPAENDLKTLLDETGEQLGRVIRRQRSLDLRVLISAEERQTGIYRLTVEASNATSLEHEQELSDASPALASVHTILTVSGGEFVSLLDPPEQLRELAVACRNVGTYPVLVGDPGDHDVLLSSPIILYDYPQIAPESAGDFFDGTEMDEMLTLRVMTLTEEEKREMRSTDDRLREMLERTEATAREQLMRTHGTFRSLKPVKGDAA
jgi:hypothetical protein